MFFKYISIELPLSTSTMTYNEINKSVNIIPAENSRLSFRTIQNIQHSNIQFSVTMDIALEINIYKYSYIF